MISEAGLTSCPSVQREGPRKQQDGPGASVQRGNSFFHGQRELNVASGRG